MKYLSTILLLFVAWTVAGTTVYRSPSPVENVEVVEQYDGATTVRFGLVALKALDVMMPGFGTGTAFRMPGGGFMAKVGAPDLPVIRRMVRVPETGKVRLEVLDTETSSLGGRYDVVPFQEPPTWSGPAPAFSIDRAIYDGASSFPASPVTLESVEIFGDIRVAWITYCPVRVNPSTGDVDLVTSATVRVSCGDEPGVNELRRHARGYTRSFVKMYDQVLGMDPINETDIIDGSYVFIGTSESIGKVEDLIKWKSQKGYQVETGLLSDIGTSVSDIDAWLEDAYNNWDNPPEYVLLVGDHDVVPSPQYSGDRTHAADNLYAVVGDGTLPSMHIGRFSGDHINDLSYIAWKTTQHEASPYQPDSINWFLRGFSMACTDFKAPEEALLLHEFFEAHAIDSDFYCKKLGGTTPSRDQVISDINEGRSVISYIGHGDITKWVTSDFRISHIANLTNGRKLPWVYTIGCQNGEFDGNYCFCEAFLSEGSVSSPKGALVIMGSSTYTPVGPGDTLQIHTFRGYFTEKLYHLGAAHTWGKTKCDEYFGSKGKDMIMMATLFGDPETSTYHDTAPIPVLHNSHSSTISSGDFSVTVTDSSSKSPVKGALVAAYYSDTDKLLDSGYTDSTGTVKLNIPSIPGSKQVTITSTAHNMSPAFTYANPTVGIEETTMQPITELFLDAPKPNPVFTSASITFGVPAASTVTIRVYDISGRSVAVLQPGELEAGVRTISWNGTDGDGAPVPDGVYVMKLEVPGYGTVSRLFSVLH